MCDLKTTFSITCCYNGMFSLERKIRNVEIMKCIGKNLYVKTEQNPKYFMKDLDIETHRYPVTFDQSYQHKSHYN